MQYYLLWRLYRFARKRDGTGKWRGRNNGIKNNMQFSAVYPIKVFVWNSLEEMVPLYDIFEF
ncbi:MAG: hypothetical protein MRZ66_03265 [Clostridiales bacterium]|nr:hypothetical protein [Clostridiales bacterium]